MARASFYRNYESKEDILVTFVIEIFHDFNNEAAYDLTEYYSYRNVCHIFTYLKTYRKYILALCHVGLGASLLEALNRFVEENAGVMPCTSIRKYRLYIFSGALMNAGLIWLKNNCPESIEAISAEFCNCLGIPLVRTMLMLFFVIQAHADFRIRTHISICCFYMLRMCLISL